MKGNLTFINSDLLEKKVDFLIRNFTVTLVTFDHNERDCSKHQDMNCTANVLYVVFTDVCQQHKVILTA